MSEFRMPSLGADMEKGILVEWNFSEGDSVKRGDVIALIETDKGLIDVEIFEDGVIEEIRVLPGQEVPVGEILAIIDGKRKNSGSVKKRKQKEKPTKSKVSPRARKLADKLGVDLGKVKGTGPSGVIEGEDVERAAKAGQRLKDKVPQTPEKQKAEANDSQSRIRKAIAGAMVRSNREIPHYYLEKSIDMNAAMRWMTLENSRRTIKERFLPAVLLIKSTAMAIRDVPQLNGIWKDDRLEMMNDINIGFSVALREGGLINTAIKNADRRSLDEIRENMNDLITRARTGRLKSSELADSTITLTYLGDKGADVVYGVIYPPQVALVGFGRIAELPYAKNGMVGVRTVASATLAADHRATDGALGSRFLESLSDYLQEVEKL